VAVLSKGALPSPEGGDALFTDLYELTMLQAYFNEGMDEEAAFELFIRSLPPQRNFLVACGLESVMQYLENLHFSPGALEYLALLKSFSRPFLDYLSRFRFAGSVRSVPEGTVIFAGEPILEVVAPLPQAQLVETFLLNQITFQTVVASKGARAVIAANGRALVDFGSRRAHGHDAALKAARALYIAGFASTSNVLAGRHYGIPVTGTMAHSYVQAHDTELDAFRSFVESYPETTLLVDTYDVEEGLLHAIRTAKERGPGHVGAIRLDSGDISSLAKQARQMLDESGLSSVRIFASGGMDEWEIRDLLAAGAPIDGFGVGTAAVVSTDAPALDSAYKLVSYAGRARLKLSADKATLPGRKQVFRRTVAGEMNRDVVGLIDEDIPGVPLLEEVMRGGKRTSRPSDPIADARGRFRRELAGLPSSLRRLEKATEPYPVLLSDGLERELRSVRWSIG
jgi:nicotinate phosphoribosyltransferase